MLCIILSIHMLHPGTGLFMMIWAQSDISVGYWLTKSELTIRKRRPIGRLFFSWDGGHKCPPYAVYLAKLVHRIVFATCFERSITSKILFVVVTDIGA